MEILGSMADVPKDLLEQIKELERLFTVDQAKLIEVTDHFVKELEKGKSSKAFGRDFHLIRGQVSLWRAAASSVIRSNSSSTVMKLMNYAAADEPYVGHGIP